MKRRHLFSTLGGVAATIVAASRASAQKGKAGAGVLSVNEYLARAALLLDETRRAQDWIGAHPGDVGLAALGLELAESRADAASAIAAPPQVKNAHMHLLLAMENTTACFDHLVRGESKKAAQRLSAARIEEQTLFSALEAAKLKMPTVK